MKKIITIGLFCSALSLAFTACHSNHKKSEENAAKPLTLEQTLQNVDTAAYLIMAANMADSSFNTLPLDFKFGQTHAEFMAHAQSIVDKGQGKIENGQLIVFSDPKRFPSNMIVNNTSLINIGTVIPDTLPVSSVEYVYHLSKTDSVEARRIIGQLMGNATKGGFKSSPVIAMNDSFVQVWTRKNLIFRVFYVYANSSLHFCATDAKTLSDKDVLGMIATIKAGAARCFISNNDIKDNVQRHCKKKYADYKPEGRWSTDWYTSSIVVRHRYSFITDNGKRVMRESMFRFNYDMKLEKEFTLSEIDFQE